MALKTPKKLDLKLKDRENPWFQIQFYGRFLSVNLLGVYDAGAEDVKDMLTLLDTKRESFGKSADYAKAIKTLRFIAKDLKSRPHARQTDHLLRQLWLSLHKARARLA